MGLWISQHTTTVGGWGSARWTRAANRWRWRCSRNSSLPPTDAASPRSTPRPASRTSPEDCHKETYSKIQEIRKEYILHVSRGWITSVKNIDRWKDATDHVSLTFSEKSLILIRSVGVCWRTVSWGRRGSSAARPLRASSATWLSTFSSSELPVSRWSVAPTMAAMISFSFSDNWRVLSVLL